MIGLSKKKMGDIMKKISLFALLVTMVLLVACSSASDDKTDSKKDSAAVETSDSDTEKEEVKVDKGLLNVEVTLPATFFEGEDIDEAIAEAKADGVSEVTKNDDGSITYKMTKSDHKKMITEMEDGIISSIEEIKNDEEFVSIKDVLHNKSFTEFTLVVDQEAFENSFDGFAAMGLGISGMYYQLFNGVEADKNKVKILFEDETSGEVFDEAIYPDALDE